jgi:phage head maturation protease
VTKPIGLDPSIGFSVEPGGERWEGRRRVVTSATVHEISLVDFGVYAPAARALDVRRTLARVR